MIGNLNAGSPWMSNLTVAPQSQVPYIPGMTPMPTADWGSGMSDFLGSQGYGGGYGGFGTGFDFGNMGLSGSGGGGGGGILGSLGGLASNIFSPSKWTPGGVGMFGNIASGLGSLGSMYFGAKNYGLTKDMMDFQKNLARANFSNQSAMAQKSMDRGRLYRRALGGVKGEPRTVLKSTI